MRISQADTEATSNLMGASLQDLPSPKQAQGLRQDTHSSLGLLLVPSVAGSEVPMAHRAPLGARGTPQTLDVPPKATVKQPGAVI